MIITIQYNIFPITTRIVPIVAVFVARQKAKDRIRSRSLLRSRVTRSRAHTQCRTRIRALWPGTMAGGSRAVLPDQSSRRTRHRHRTLIDLVPDVYLYLRNNRYRDKQFATLPGEIRSKPFGRVFDVVFREILGGHRRPWTVRRRYCLFVETDERFAGPIHETAFIRAAETSEKTIRIAPGRIRSG